mmetsp:Transcript_123652/g.385014  ORF Transcript_123652/g.385014 Transcript_123652/m.385014 type:complete len:117 (-) Transcript_123652:109-459(-)
MTELRIWEEKHERELEQSADKEQSDRRARRQAADDELQRWHQERGEEVQKRRTSKRAEEQAASELQMDAAEKVGNPWERVVDLINTSARVSDESRDTSRMAALLIHLKNTPVAVAA